MSSVEQVGDARSELERLNKSKLKDAQWVTGLEDEATLAAYFARLDAAKKRMAKKQAKRMARGVGGDDGLQVPDVDVSSEEEEEDAIQVKGRFRKANASSGLVETINRYGEYLVEGINNIRTMWLFWPCIFITIATLLAAMQHFLTFQFNQRFNHPQNEVSLWRYARRDSATEIMLFEFLPFNLFHIFGALGALTLCFQLGSGTQNFTAFCGVGCAVLALAAIVLDGLLAVKACPYGRDTTKECDYPFGSHWALTCVKNLGSTVGVACAAFVLDSVQNQLVKNSNRNSGIAAGKTSPSWTGTIITSAPAVLFFVFYAITFYYGVSDGNTQYVVDGISGKPAAWTSQSQPLSKTILYYASLAQVIAWSLLIPTIHKQRRLMLVHATDVDQKHKQD